MLCRALPAPGLPNPCTQKPLRFLHRLPQVDIAFGACGLGDGGKQHGQRPHVIRLDWVRGGEPWPARFVGVILASLFEAGGRL